MPPEPHPAGPADHYTLLGIDRLADPETLRRAYRSQAKLMHPDAFPLDSAERLEAEASFKALTHAYEILSDRARRAAYDATLPPEPQPAPEPEPEEPVAFRPARPRVWEAPADPVMRKVKKAPKPAGPPAFMDVLRDATRRRGFELPDD
jgi:curved DNA-binding protein CbpA